MITVIILGLPHASPRSRARMCLLSLQKEGSEQKPFQGRDLLSEAAQLVASDSTSVHSKDAVERL